MTDRKGSVSFAFPTLKDDDVLENTHSSRTRSTSQAAHDDLKREYSYSVSSVASTDSQDPKRLKRKTKYEDIDLENQLIMTAGGRERVVCLVLKLVFLATVILGCSVLIFYAL